MSKPVWTGQVGSSGADQWNHSTKFSHYDNIGSEEIRRIDNQSSVIIQTLRMTWVVLLSAAEISSLHVMVTITSVIVSTSTYQRNSLDEFLEERRLSSFHFLLPFLSEFEFNSSHLSNDEPMVTDDSSKAMNIKRIIKSERFDLGLGNYLCPTFCFCMFAKKLFFSVLSKSNMLCYGSVKTYN